jgi:ABC-2 type transport system permease protein/lipopolysaccharide transport system permease protein
MISILRFFVAMFYAKEWVSPGVQTFIEYNPPYIYIKVARDMLIYGVMPETVYLLKMVVYGVGFYAIGKIIFNKCKDNVLVRL